MRIVLLRHGQTDWNAERRTQGWTDNPMNAVGVSQAQAAADRLTNMGVEHFYSSDSRRAHQTAQIVNEKLNLPLILDKRLRERDSGDLNGKIKSQLPYIKDFHANPHKYNAETYDDVFSRVKSFFTELKASGKNNVLIVSHGRAISIMLYYFTGQQEWNYNKYAANHTRIENGEILELEI